MAWEEKIAKRIAELERGDAKIRREAATRLGALGSCAAVEALCLTLQDSSWRVRRSAAHALGRIGDADAVEPLIQSLHDSKSDVRKSAAWALGKIGDARGIAPLCRMLSDRSAVVRKGTGEALQRIGSPAAAALCRKLSLESAQATVRERQWLQQWIVQQGADVLLAAEPLTPQERWASLTVLQDHSGELPLFSACRRQLGNLRRLSETALQSENAAVRQGAQALLDYMTLARASQRDLTAESGTLLRIASDGSVAHRGDTLLRAAGEEGKLSATEPASAEGEPPAGEASFFGKLKRLFRRPQW